MSDIWMAIGVGVAGTAGAVPTRVGVGAVAVELGAQRAPEERRRVTQQIADNYTAGFVAGIEQNKEQR